MSGKKLFIFILFGIAIIVLIFFVFKNTMNFQGSETGLVATTSEEAVATPREISTSTNFTGSLNTLPGSLDAPQQLKIENNQIPSGAIKIEVSDSGFSPKEITTFANQPVSLVITAKGESTHVFLFPDASLMGLTMMINSGETKVINFTAPAAGNYVFRDDIPSFRANTGLMIVK